MTGFDGIELGSVDRLLQGAELRKKQAERPSELPGAEDDLDFGKLLVDGVRGVAARQHESVDKLKTLATGGPVDVHDVMLSMGKSEVAFSLMLEIRNKLVDAWKEISRIQV